MKADTRKDAPKHGKGTGNPESGNNKTAGKPDISPRPNNPAKNADLKAPDNKSTKLKADD